MRGQVYASNGSVVSHPLSGIDPVQRTLNQFLQINSFTATGYKNAFFGSSLSGIGVSPPPPRQLF
jgi:hypothetical protein